MRAQPLLTHIGDGEQGHLPSLLLLLAHKHGRSHQQHVGHTIFIHIERAEHTAEVRADLQKKHKFKQIVPKQPDHHMSPHVSTPPHVHR